MVDLKAGQNTSLKAADIDAIAAQLGLPVANILAELRAAMLAKDTAVLEAAPGAGKTTIVPLALLSEPYLTGQKIIVLEPRRLAARAAAERMASLINETVGGLVGFRVRLDSKVGPKTRIEVVTEGVFTKMLQHDPGLEQVGLVIFDEFHERHLDGDLGLALCLESRELFRERPLKILLMSATLDGDSLLSKLGDASLVRSQGRQYPVELVYTQQNQLKLYGQNRRQLVPTVAAKVAQVFTQQPSNVLVFLPGQAEIKQCQALLEAQLQLSGLLADFSTVLSIVPLYGELKLEQQRQAIAACPAGQYKIVLATSIAESSLTIEGVTSVIDAGLVREAKFDPKTSMTRLATVRVSQAASKQRAGRAGRQQAGSCYRLWSQTEQHGLAEFSEPEIAHSDLSNTLLALAAWGIDDVNELRWISPPPSAPVDQAQQLLLQLGALEAINPLRVSPHGEQMSAVAAHPRIANMLIRASKLNCFDTACAVAAVLSERDFLDRHRYGVDLGLRMQALRGEIKTDLASNLVKKLKQSQTSFAKLALNKSHSNSRIDSFEAADAEARLLCLAYPEQIARQLSNDGQRCVYQLANGRQAFMHSDDPLSRAPVLVIAHLGGRDGDSRDQIFLATAVNFDLMSLAELLPLKTETRQSWDVKSGLYKSEVSTFLGRLKINTVKDTVIDPELRTEALLLHIQKTGLDCLNWSAEATQLKCRLQLVDRLGDKTGWPACNDQSLIDDLPQWLGPYLSGVDHLNKLKNIDIKGPMLSRLDWAQQTELERLVPISLLVASGSKININYNADPPVLAVKLQEMFGCQQTPKILNGRLAIMVHLLSPARRPLQITQDLAGFWQGSYHEVKKEMKGRYPKHPWPDDPINAQATKKVKKYQP